MQCICSAICFNLHVFATEPANDDDVDEPADAEQDGIQAAPPLLGANPMAPPAGPAPKPAAHAQHDEGDGAVMEAITLKSKFLTKDPTNTEEFNQFAQQISIGGALKIMKRILTSNMFIVNASCDANDTLDILKKEIGDQLKAIATSVCVLAAHMEDNDFEDNQIVQLYEQLQFCKDAMRTSFL